MADEPIQPEDTPAETAPVEPTVDTAPAIDMPPEDAPTPEPPVDDVSIAPVEPDVAPVESVDNISPDPPADPIITDPVLTDVPVDSVFDVPLQLLDTAAVAVLADMPDEDKTAIKDAIDGAIDYWGPFQHFPCPVPQCQKDFLSYAAMVSHRMTEHWDEDLDAPVGTQATYDRFGNFLGYEEFT